MMRFARSSLTRYMAATLAAIFFSTSLVWAGESVKHRRHSPDHIGVDTNGLVLHLPLWMYDASTTKAWDISGQNNHGSIVGAVPHPHYGPELLSNTGFEAGTADGSNLITNAGFETIGSELTTNGSMEAGTADASELVLNGGFDSATTNWATENSTLASVAGGQAGNCLEITRTAGSTQIATQGFTLDTNKYYKLSGYVKSGSSGNEEFFLRMNDGTTNFQTVSTSSGAWVAITPVYFKPVAASCTLTLAKNTATAGTMLFDSISLKEAIPGPNLVSNGTMEAGTADGSELISNGGFDSATTDWTGSDATIASVAGGESGNCLELTRTGGDLQYVSSTNNMSVISGHYYRLKAYVKSGTSGNENGRVKYYDGTTDVSKSFTSSGSWVLVELVFKAGGTETDGYVMLIKDTATPGTMLFDSISVKECFPPTGWVEWATPSVIDRSTVQTKTGTYSAHIITGPFAGANPGMLHENIPVVAGKTYRFSYWYYLVSGTSHSTFLDTGGGEVSGGYAHDTTVGAWTYRELITTQPYTGNASIVFNRWDDAEFYVDDVQVQELQVSSGYSVDGWSDAGTTSLLDRSAVVAAHAGSYSIHVVQNTGTYNGGAVRAVSKTSGKTYRFSFWYYLISGQVYATLLNGNNSGDLGSVTGTTTGVWTYLEATFTETITGGTGTARFINGNGPAEFYIDDVSVVEVLSGWTVAMGAGSVSLASAAGEYHAGTYGTKLTNGAPYTDINQSAAVTTGSYYRLTFWTRGDTVNQSQYEVWDDTNSADIKAVTNSGVTSATYAQVSYFFKAPTGCVSVRVLFFSPAGSVYIDDVSLQEVFAPTGWTPENSAEAVNRSTVQKNNGSYSMHVVESGTSYGGSVQAVSKVVGKRYQLSYWYYLVSGALAVRVQSGNASADLVSQNQSTTGSWIYSEATFNETVTGSTGAVEFREGVGSAGEFYIDDVSLKEVYGYEVLGLGFDGVDDVVTVSNSSSLNSITAFTYLAWVKWEQQSGTDVFILMGRTDGQTDFGITSTGLVEFYDGAWKSTTYTITPGTWTLLGFTWDGTNLKTYANGVYIGSVVGGSWPDSKAIAFGATVAGGSFLKANKGMEMIFSRTFTNAEHNEVYEATRWRYGK